MLDKPATVQPVVNSIDEPVVKMPSVTLAMVTLLPKPLAPPLKPSSAPRPLVM